MARNGYDRPAHGPARVVRHRHRRRGWTRVKAAIAVVLALVLLPGGVPFGGTASAAVAGTWNGSRAELFLVDIAPPQLTPGGPARALTAAVVNRGPGAASNVRFSYTVPTGLAVAAATVGGGSCAVTGGTVGCTVAGLANGATAPVSISLAAPAGATVGTKPGSFSPVTSDQFNPAGGNLLLRTRTDDWVGDAENTALSATWQPADPYTGPAAPCVSTTDSLGRAVNCGVGVLTSTVQAAGFGSPCSATTQVCLRTWEIVGTYYAAGTGALRVCGTDVEDGAYVNWSAGYDPATTAAPPAGSFTAHGEMLAHQASWVTDTWQVTAGQAYRFSIRIANRDNPGALGIGPGGFTGLGVSAVDGTSASCSFANFFPSRPAAVPVRFPSATITLNKTLGTDRVIWSDQFTVRIRNSAGFVVNDPRHSTTLGFGNQIDFGSGTTGTTPVAPGSRYTLTEAAAATTKLSDYKQTISCTNDNRGSTTPLPSGPVDLAHPPTVTPADDDEITCDLGNAGVPPMVTIRTTTQGGDATFHYSAGGGNGGTATVTTSGGLGTATLANTQAGQALVITQAPQPDWSLSTILCTNLRTGEVLFPGYLMGLGDQIVCSFVNRSTAPQPCVTNPVRNPDFASGSANWNLRNFWPGGGRITDTNGNATYPNDFAIQNVAAVAPGSRLNLTVLANDGVGGQGGNEADLRLIYGGVTYAQLDSAPANEGFDGTATVHALNGAGVNVATIPMGMASTIVVTLPNAIPRSGNVEFRMAVVGNNDTHHIGDDWGITNVLVQTTGICLRKQSTGGFATFGFTTTNLDTNTLGDAAFTVTTSPGANPAVVNPVFGSTGPQGVVVDPGSRVTITETGPPGWALSASCVNMTTGAAVPGVTVLGATVIVPGVVMPAGTLLNCLLSNAQASGFTVSKTAGPATAGPGQTVTYTVTAHNGGTVAVPGASLTDDLSDVIDDAAFGSVTADIGTAAFTSPNLSWTGDLPAGATATIRYTVTVDSPDAGNHSLVNRVTTTATGTNCLAASTDPACATTTPVADSRLLKTVDRTSATVGDVVTYTVQMGNNGQTPLTGATFTDDLTGVLDDATFDSSSAGFGTATFTSPNLTWVGDLAPGAVVQVVYTVTVHDPGTGDHRLSNRATSTTVGSNCPPPTPTSSNCLTDTPVAELAVSKTTTESSTFPGGQVHYTVTVSNLGATTQSGTLFIDDLTDVLDDAGIGSITATRGSASLATPTLVYSGTLLPGDVATVSYVATVHQPDTGNHVLVNLVSSTAPGSSCPPVPRGPRAATCTTTVAVGSVQLSKSVNRTETSPGDTVTYTATVHNGGQAVVTGATFTDDLSGVTDDAVLGTPVATGGTVAIVGNTLTWSGDLAVGATVTVTYPATVRSPDPGDHRLTNVLASTNLGADCPGPGPAPAPNCVTDTPVADLSIVKTVVGAITSAAPGQEVQYLITVANIGQVPYATLTGVDDLTDVLDDADFVSAVPSGGTVSFTPPLLSWTSVLPVGAAGQATVTVRVKNPDPGDHHLINSVSSTALGSSCPGAATCSTDIPVADLTVAKSVDTALAVPGQIVTYTVTVTNNGAITLTGLVGIDDVHGVLDDATFLDAVASGGEVTFDPAGQLLVWNGGNIPLPPGFSATVTYRFQVNNPDTGDRRLINSLSSTALGSSCPGGPQCATDTPVAVLDIAKQVNPTTVEPGASATYTITVSNTGQAPFTGATVSDDLADVLDDAVVDQVSATTGSAGVAGTLLTWTGDLAPGAQALVTYRATVDNPDTGNRELTNLVTSDTPGSTCPVGGTVPACTATALVPALEIVKQVSSPTANAGDTLTYTVTVRNSGTVAIPGGQLTDDLSDVLDDAAFGTLTPPSIGTATFNPGPATVTWTGALDPGDVTTIAYTVVVLPVAVGNNVMHNVVVSTTAGSNCPADSTDPACTTTSRVNGLTFLKTSDHVVARGGDTVTYTVTVTNSGTTTVTDARFTDDLTDVLDDATFGTVTASSIGTAVFTPPAALDWTGTLTPGDVATVRYTVVVGSQTGPSANHELVNRISSTSAGSDCPPGATNPACTTVTPVQELLIVKTVDTAQAGPGDKVTYTVTLTNTGAVDYPDATFTDDLTGVLDDASYVSGTAATGGTLSFATPDLTWVGSMPPGAVRVVTYTVQVLDPPPGDALLTNRVVATGPGASCPPTAPCVTNTPIPRLAITKTAAPAGVLPGDTVTYTVVVTNTGTVPFDPATFTDDLTGVLDDATVDPATVTATAGTPTLSGATLTWSGPLAPTGSATIGYRAVVKTAGLGDHQLVNALTSATPDNNCPCATTTPIGGMAIAKRANTASTSAGDTVSYSILVANSGQTELAAQITDDLAGVTDDADVTNVRATSGTPVLAGATLTWTDTLPVTGFAVIFYDVVVHQPDTGNHLLSNVVTSTTPGSNCMAGSVGAACRLDIPVAELRLTKTVDTDPALPGEPVTYTVTAANVGQVPYNPASFTDDLGGALDDADFTSATADIGVASFASPDLNWSGALPPGATATVRYTLTVRFPTSGDHVLDNSVTSTSPGANCAGAAACTTATDVADVHIVKTVDADVAAPGATLTYTVAFANTGEAALPAATFTDDLSGVLDDATLGTTTATIGTVGVLGTTLTWTGALDPGQNAIVTYQVTVLASGRGDNVLRNQVLSTSPGSNCPDPTFDPASCATATPVAALAITKVATPNPATPGAVVTYALTIQNLGQTVQSGVLLTDSLAGVLDDADVLAVEPPPGVTATHIGDQIVVSAGLPPGSAAITVRYTVQVHQTGFGDKHLVNLVTSTVPGASCPPVSPCQTDTPIQSLAITKTVDRPGTFPGDTVTYTLVIANTGAVALAGVRVVDDLSDVLDEATPGTVADSGGGSASFTAPGLVWTGDLPVGGPTVTVTYTVIVQASTTGNHLLHNSVTSTVPGSTCTPAAPCTTDTPVAQLNIGKTVDRATAAPGDTVRYTVTVTNAGRSDYPAATFTDDLSGVLDDATLTGTDASTGTVGLVGTDLTWTGSLAAGGTATVAYVVTVDKPDAGDHVMTNAVASTIPGTVCEPCGTVTEVTELVIVKVAAPSSTAPGGVVTYTVTLTNSGDLPYTDITVGDKLADVLDDATFGSASATSGTVAFDPPSATLTWSGSVPAHGAVTVTATVTVNTPDTGNHDLANEVGSTAPGANCTPTAPCRTSTPVSDIVMDKRTDVDSVTPGQPVAYTLTLTNRGLVPQVGVSATDDLSGVTDDAAVTGAVADAGVVSVSGTTLTWSGDLPLNAVVTITYLATVHDPDTGDHHLINTATFHPGSAAADVVDAVSPGVAGRTSCTSGEVCTTDTPVTELTVTKTATPSSANPGDTVRYGLVIDNTGATDLPGVVVTDDLSGVLDDATFQALSPVPGAVFAANAVTWTGDLAAGAEVTITYTVLVNHPGTGDRVLVNAVTSDQPGSNCTRAQPCRTSTPIHELEIVKAADVGPAGVGPGDQVSYTLVVANRGPQVEPAATVTDDLSGVLDDATLVSSAADTGTVTPVGTTLVWTGALGINATATITYTVRVDDPDTGDHRLDNAVTSTSPLSNCPPVPGDTSCATSTDVDELRLAKTATPAVAGFGDLVTYTVTATNLGPRPVTDATFVDNLTDVLDDAQFVSAATDVGTVVLPSPNLVWSAPTLAPGQVATITYQVRVKTAGLGNFSLVNTVTSTTPGANCTAAAPCTTTTPVQGITITKSASDGVVAPGGRLTYTVTVTNMQPAPATGVSVTDDLTGVLDDADLGTPSATTGAVVVAGPTVTWTGDLAAGQTAVITYVVTVHDPVDGDHHLVNSVTGPDNSSCVAPCSTDTPIADLRIVKTADRATVGPGGTVGYRLEISNVGASAQSPLTVVDDLGGVLGNAGPGAVTSVSTGQARFITGGLRWDGALEPGQVAVVAYTVVVDAGAARGAELVNSVGSDALGSGCPLPTPATVAAVAAGSAGVLRPAAATAAPGSTCAVTVTISSVSGTPPPTATPTATPPGPTPAPTVPPNMPVTGLTWAVPVGLVAVLFMLVGSLMLLSARRRRTLG